MQRLGWEAREQVLASELLPERLPERYAQVSEELLVRIGDAFEAAGEYRQIRLHGDCHLGNLLWNEHGPVFVDLDDCATGPRVQDLWMMLSGSPDEQQHQWAQLLEGYTAVRRLRLRRGPPDRAAACAAHAPPCSLGGAPLGRPGLPARLPVARRGRYWEGYLQDLREQLFQIEDPPCCGARGGNANRRTCAAGGSRVIVQAAVGP